MLTPVSLHEHHWPRVTTESMKSGSMYPTQSHIAMSNPVYCLLAGPEQSPVSIA